MTTSNKCGLCRPPRCCVYFTQQIDTPRSKADFEVLLWQLAHKNSEYYKDEDGWFLMVNSPCKFLDHKGGCSIYETRPQICRDYSNDWCEYDEPPEQHFALHFTSYESLLAYCKKRFKSWAK